MSDNLITPRANSDERWKFLRDVVVFQLKMLLDNVRDLVLMPVALVGGAARPDPARRAGGSAFLQGAAMGLAQREGDRSLQRHRASGAGQFTISRDYTVDGVIARLENVVAREVEKGGTAASIKSAMDRTIDQIHAGTGGARDAVVRTADELRKKFESDRG